MIKVVILGAGNVATHLFKAFQKSDKVMVVQWFNRDLEKLIPFNNEVGITNGISDLESADVYFISVTDDAISEISEALPFEDRLVVHTSGTVNIHDLDKKNRRGVFYPLQTFSKSVDIDFKKVPICLETIEKDDYKLLKTAADSISDFVKKVNSDQRAALHLGAVFVNNFVNQLYRLAHEITESTGAEFDMLKPLILETALKVQDNSPFRAQTGPALRGDKSTIKAHLKRLQNEHHKDIYEILTQSIKNTHGR
ncbi:MAG: Rossmann-like and DUF2520 domain-containing protein [Bacteroidota bacterium]